MMVMMMMMMRRRRRRWREVISGLLLFLEAPGSELQGCSTGSFGVQSSSLLNIWSPDGLNMSALQAKYFPAPALRTCR